MIRPYKPEDRQQVEHCIIELQDFERTLEEDRVEGAGIAERYLDELLTKCQKKPGQIFVAEVDASVAGFLCLWQEHEADTYLSNLNECIYISDVVVLPEYRRKGLGSALMQHAIDFAARQGARNIKIGVLARNEGAKELYLQMGFREYEIILLKKIDTNLQAEL